MKKILMLSYWIIGGILLFFIFKYCNNSIAENVNNTDDELFKIVKNDKFGFINIKGEIIIPIKYHSAGHFSGDLCPVRLHGTIWIYQFSR